MVTPDTEGATQLAVRKTRLLRADISFYAQSNCVDVWREVCIFWTSFSGSAQPLLGGQIVSGACKRDRTAQTMPESKAKL